MKLLPLMLNESAQALPAHESKTTQQQNTMGETQQDTTTAQKWGVFAFASYALLGGGLTLAGWLAEIPRLTDWLGSGISMFPNAAFGGACLGMALLTALLKSGWSRRLSALLGLAVALLGSLTLFEHIFGINLGIDTFLVEPTWGEKAAMAPGRIGPPASTAFTLLGVAVALLSIGGKLRPIVPILGLGTALIALLPLIGYLFGADPLFSMARVTGIAMQTATVLLALAIGTVASVPEHQPMRILCQNSAAGVLARRSLPLIIVLPIALGWLRVRAQDAGLLDTGMGTGLLVLLLIGMLCTLLWWCIAEVAKREKALHQSERRLHGIISSAMDAVITIDSQQRIVLFNPAAEKMFGVRSAEIEGKKIDTLIPARFRAAHGNHVKSFGQTGDSTRKMGALGAISGLRANGEEFPIAASISHVEIGGEQLFTVIARDITEQKRTEEELRRTQQALMVHAASLEETVAERTARLRETVNELQCFSYSIAHDMRAPLRAMGSFAELLLDESKSLNEESRDFGQRIVTSAKRLDNLILDALNYTKAVLKDFPLEPVDLSNLLRGLIDTYPNLHHSKADIRIENDLPVVMGNESLLTQCFSNLLGNAVKFVAPGKFPRVRVRSELNGSTARIWVADNGIGIPRDAHSRLFGMFQKLDSQYEGTGMGLAIVRKVTERMGGRVGVETAPGQGSRFWVELRVAQETRNGMEKLTEPGASARTDI